MFVSIVDCWPEASVRVIRGRTCLTGARTIRENQELKDIDSWIIAAEGIAASSQVNKGGVSVEKCEGRDTITLGTAALPLSSGNYSCWPPLTSFSNFYFQISNSPHLDLLKLSTCGQWLLVSYSKDLLYEKKVAEREKGIKTQSCSLATEPPGRIVYKEGLPHWNAALSSSQIPEILPSKHLHKP